MSNEQIQNTTPVQYVRNRSELTTVELEKRLKNLSILKRAAFDEGKSCRIIRPRSIPETFGKGHVAEIGISGMLGRLDSFYKEKYDIDFRPSFNFISDMHKKSDMVVCGMDIDIQSQFIYEKRDPRYTPIDTNSALVFYDKPGAYNMFIVLSTINLLRPIEDDNIISDLNYIWELYMVVKIRRDVFITHNDYSDKDLDKYELYLEDFPCLIESNQDPNTNSQDVDIPKVDGVEPATPIKKKNALTKDSLIEKIQNLLFELNITEENIFDSTELKTIETQLKNEIYKIYGHKYNMLKIILDVFPNLNKKIRFFEYKKNKLEISKKLLSAKLKSMYSTKEELCENISKENVNSFFFDYIIEIYYDNSLYSFVNSICSDINIWDIKNIDHIEYNNSDHLKKMCDILIDEMGLNLKNIKFITMGNIKSIHMGTCLMKLIPSVISDEASIIELIEYRLIELEGGSKK